MNPANLQNIGLGQLGLIGACALLAVSFSVAEANRLAGRDDVPPVLAGDDPTDRLPCDVEAIGDHGLAFPFNVQASNLDGIGGGNLRTADPFPPRPAFGLSSGTVLRAASRIESASLLSVPDVVAVRPVVKMGAVATGGVVARVADEQRISVSSVMEEERDARCFEPPTCGLEVPVTVAEGAREPRPALVRAAPIDLRPEAGNVTIRQTGQRKGLIAHTALYHVGTGA